MKTPPKPWIHTGLNIHPRLARFLKKWGFVRDCVNCVVIPENTLFVAIVNGKAFDFLFSDNGPINIKTWGGQSVFVDNNIRELENFMRDNS